MAQNQVGNASFSIVVPPVILLVPICLSKGKVGVCENVMLDTMMPRYLISSDSVEELVLFAKYETIQVNPSTMDSGESNVKVLLVILGSLQKRYVGQLG